MRVTFSIDDNVLRLARRHAAALGATVGQLIREYLERLAGHRGSAADAAEFERLSLLVSGDSRGWKFNRDELHERR